ncbi:Aquaporin-3 [Toxocara canis]|uniref:Aquaporin-3 n=1 Tax=Toxocara canis TaxID=6265 RepID=A0A0B2W4I3_TOXCA|nr:Aquaporin-3 [Toxocara canis]
MDSPIEKCRRALQIKSQVVVNCLSELYGTCLLLFIGIGIVCQFDLSHKSLNTWIQINVGWGFAITFCVYTISKTSGGHLNPAISLMFYTFGKLPLIHVLYYSIAQTVGAFIGTALAYTLYYDQIWHALGAARIAVGPNATATLFTSMPPEHVSNVIAFYDQHLRSPTEVVVYSQKSADGLSSNTIIYRPHLRIGHQIWHALGAARIAVGPNATATLFTSMPPEHVSNVIAFYDQFVGTGFLALFVAVIVDKRNEIPVGIHPLLVGFVIAMIGMAFGMNVGYPINPARDFAPRLFAALIGYGPEMFTYHNYYFWIPIIAPFFGAVFAAWSYYLFVGFHIVDRHPSPIYMKDIKDDSGDSVPLKKNSEKLSYWDD